MKKQITLWLLSGLVVLAGACVSVAQSAAPDVIVHSFHWRTRAVNAWSGGISPKDLSDYSKSDLGNPERRNTRSDPQRLSLPSPNNRTIARQYFNGYQSFLQLENTGNRTITSVEWEHIFFSDVEKRNEVNRFHFIKKLKIEPGMQKFVGQRVKPKRPMQLPTAERQSIILDRITYADGSVWQRP